VNSRLPPELARLIEKKVLQGLATAKAGKLVDSEVAIKRLHARLDKLEQARRRR
jgi:predicted transcriptional regulator